MPHDSYIKFKFSVAISKILVKCRPFIIYVLFMDAFVLQQWSLVVAPDTIWPAELKILTILPLTENLCQPLS